MASLHMQESPLLMASSLRFSVIVMAFAILPLRRVSVMSAISEGTDMMVFAFLQDKSDVIRRVVVRRSVSVQFIVVDFMVVEKVIMLSYFKLQI